MHLKFPTALLEYLNLLQGAASMQPPFPLRITMIMMLVNQCIHNCTARPIYVFIVWKEMFNPYESMEITDDFCYKWKPSRTTQPSLLVASAFSVGTTLWLATIQKYMAGCEASTFRASTSSSYLQTSDITAEITYLDQLDLPRTLLIMLLRK